MEWTRVAPVYPVADVAKAIEWYSQVFGFEARIVNPPGVHRRKTSECGCQVLPHVPIGILLNQERGRGVPDVEEHDAGIRPGLADKSLYVARNLAEPLPVRFDAQARSCDKIGDGQRDLGKCRHVFFSTFFKLVNMSTSWRHILPTNAVTRSVFASLGKLAP